MQNREVIKEMLQKFYHSKAFTRHYIMVFVLDGVVYAVICDCHMVDKVTCLDMASRGAGYALRFKPNKAQKIMLLKEGAITLCSEEFFNTLVRESKYNRGEIAEKLVTEYAGQTWVKDNVPFTEAGDIEWDGVAYQIKFEKATFINEKTMANMR